MTTGQLDEALRIDVEEPRRERYGPLYIAGIRREHPLVDASVQALDVQWRDLRVDLARMDTGRNGAPVTFGVFDDMFTDNGTFTHLCGVHVDDPSRSGDDVPEFVERYGPDFDPDSEEGSIEVWFPIQR